VTDLAFATSADVERLLAKHKDSRRSDDRPAAPDGQRGADHQASGSVRILIPRRGIPVEMVIAGGQTGADRAGLDAALAVGLPIDGYCPKGRLAEDGLIPERFTLTETGTSDYGERTALNVKHSSASLVLSFRSHDDLMADRRGGTAMTIRLCAKHERPCLPVQLHPTLRASDRMVAQVVAWLRKRQVRVLNVAGPRESKEPGLYAAALAFLTRVLGQEAAAEQPTVAPLLEMFDEPEGA
jgi:hypothetical protein